MRSRWKKLCLWAASVLSLTLAVGPVRAQFGSLPPPAAEPGPGPTEPPFSMRDDGRPNAFTNLMDVRTKNSEPYLPTFIRRGVDRIRPGLIFPVLTPARAAEFPNPAQESNEPVSPFMTREEGVSNAFTELRDPRWRGPISNAIGGTRLLFTELFNPPPQVFNTHIVNIRGEAIFWRVPNGPIAVPTVTTTATPTLANRGQLGDPNTVILLGAGNVIDYGVIPGYRLSADVTTLYTPPIQVSGFSLQRTTTLFSAGSLTNPTQTLAVPYQDVDPRFIIPGTQTGLETAQLISIPIGNAIGAQGGTIAVTSSMSLWGIDGDVFFPLGESDVLGLRVSLGYKHLSFRENLQVNTSSGGLVGGTQFNGFRMPNGIFFNTTNDTFETTNSLDAGTIGLRGALGRERWSLIADTKFGIGPSKHTLNIEGITTLIPTAGGASQTSNGGLFALSTNSGFQSITALSLTFEASLALSYQVNQAIRLYGGFNYMWWNFVARPGDFVNHLLDARQIPTSGSYQTGLNYNGPAPVTSVTIRDLSVYGLFVGMEIGF